MTQGTPNTLRLAPPFLAIASLLSACGGGSDAASPSLVVETDTTPPVITIIGSNPYRVELGTLFIDPMATSDGGEAIQSDASKSLNMLASGVYEVTYQAEDQAGNVGYAVRDVLVEHRSQKRGFAYGNGAGIPISDHDLSTLAGKIRWWYDWSVSPEPAVENSFHQTGHEFVPMTWGKNFDEASLRVFLDNSTSANSLLGFNEPNFGNQANLTPAEAALAWPRLEAIALDYDLNLVSPAVNHCANNCVYFEGYDDPSRAWAYLDAFFDECRECKVDAIAIHWYGSDFERFTQFVMSFEKYNLPIWVTEWSAMGPNVTVARQMDYLAETVRWMERSSSVSAYAWFIARSRDGLSNWPFNSLLGADGQLTPLGALYAGLPSTNFLHAIPGVLEAEASHEMTGFRHKSTSDEFGYVDLYAIAGAEQRLTFLSELQVPGRLKARVRFAAAGPISLDLLVNGSLVGSLEGLSSGGNDIWSFAEISLGALNSGKLTLELAGTYENNLKINFIELIYE